jgi:hypothetical protein
MGWMNPIHELGRLRVSDTFTVQAYYTSQGGRRVHLHGGVVLGCICE